MERDTDVSVQSFLSCIILDDSEHNLVAEGSSLEAGVNDLDLSKNDLYESENDFCVSKNGFGATGIDLGVSVTGLSLNCNRADTTRGLCFNSWCVWEQFEAGVDFNATEVEHDSEKTDFSVKSDLKTFGKVLCVGDLSNRGNNGSSTRSFSFLSKTHSSLG